jgi:hypothetical protein
MESANPFQYLFPLEANDPDRKMHQYLRDEFLGQPGPGLVAPTETEKPAPETAGTGPTG